MKKPIILICKKVIYFSPDDEFLFFNWIKKINCIVEIKGEGDSLYLFVDSSNISYSDLKNLIGLFYRYNITMKQLAQFLTAENKSWFAHKSAPWYRAVFGISRNKN